MRGHIRKRGNTWAVVVDLGVDESGRRRQKWHGGYRTKKDASQGLTEILSKLSAGTYVEPTKQTVAVFLREWLPAIRSTIRPGTWTSYRTNMERHVIPRIGTRQLRSINAMQLNALYAELLTNGRCDGKGGLSPRTVKYTHVILHRALRDAVRWELIPRNPADLAEPPSGSSPEMKVWTAEELRKFLGSVRTDRLYALWVLLSTTGLRRGEALGLRWADLDVENGRAAIRQTVSSVGGKVTYSKPKTLKSRRSVALDPETLTVVRAHRRMQVEERLAWGDAYQETDLVFAREDGSPIRPDTITRRFQQLATDCGLRPLRLHDLRVRHEAPCIRAG